MTGSCQVSTSDAARALLGMVSRAEAVPVETLEEFARAVLEADPVGRLAVRVLDSGEARRLARAIELAGAVLDTGAACLDVPAARALE